MGDYTYTYSDLWVSPYKFQKIIDFRLEQKLNDHARISINGIIDEENLDKYVENSNDNEKLEVSLKSKDGETFVFKGLVTNISIDASNNVRRLSIEGMSETILMDISRKRRSFQNVKMTYSDLLKEITKEYKNASTIDEVTSGATLDGFTLQYDETDWEFVRRIASRFNAPLVVNPVIGGAKYHVGICKPVQTFSMDEFNYSMKKDLRGYMLKSENGMEGIKEQNAVSYEIFTEKVIGLCSTVIFKDRTLYVFESETFIRDGVLLNRYVLRDDSGMKRPEGFNEKLSGASIEGSVIDVSKDKVKVHLDIDEKQDKETATWFPYSTVYSSPDGSGWYCMPEIKDRVRLYIPDKKEENAVVSSSVNMKADSGGKRSDPAVKSISTKYGKKVVFKPGAIEIIGNGKTLIRLTDDGGIEINSGSKISISAQDDIEINGGSKVVIQGDEGVDLKQANATLSIKEDVTISGARVNIE